MSAAARTMIGWSSSLISLYAVGPTKLVVTRIPNCRCLRRDMSRDTSLTPTPCEIPLHFASRAKSTNIDEAPSPIRSCPIPSRPPSRDGLVTFSEVISGSNILATAAAQCSNPCGLRWKYCCTTRTKAASASDLGNCSALSRIRWSEWLSVASLYLFEPKFAKGQVHLENRPPGSANPLSRAWE